MGGMGEERLRVLLVEDEPSIRAGLCDVLRFRGYVVETAEDGASALARALDQRFDLIVLDLMLPKLDGFQVCAQLRAHGRELPILMLTAKGAEDDVLRGFEAGADDYVTKPFSVRELLARVQVLVRRSGRVVSERFRAGPFEIDPGRSVASCEELVVQLTAREVRILRLLSAEPGRIVSRRALLRDGWDMNNTDQVETRTVDVHIAKLRKKLGKRGDSLVETIRGQGYRLWTDPS
jgi:DNA-binding response OmpR family regulator